MAPARVQTFDVIPHARRGVLARHRWSSSPSRAVVPGAGSHWPFRGHTRRPNRRASEDGAIVVRRPDFCRPPPRRTTLAGRTRSAAPQGRIGQRGNNQTRYPRVDLVEPSRIGAPAPDGEVGVDPRGFRRAPDAVVCRHLRTVIVRLARAKGAHRLSRRAVTDPIRRASWSFPTVNLSGEVPDRFLPASLGQDRPDRSG